MIQGSGQGVLKRKNLLTPCIYDRIQLERVDKEKDLAVTVDSKLNLRDHIKY